MQVKIEKSFNKLAKNSFKAEHAMFYLMDVNAEWKKGF